MARKKSPVEDAQPPLVPMTEEELGQARHDLAYRIRELEDMEAQHADVSAQQRKARKTLKGKIAALAGTILQQGR